MPFEDYKEIDAINASMLQAFHQRPDKATVEKADTAAMRLGRRIHRAILEPNMWCPDESMTWYKTKPPKITEELASIIGMLDALDFGTSNSTAQNLIEHAAKELVFVWEHPTYGVLCKARLDLLLPKLGTIADIKSCQNADFARWRRTVFNADVNPYFQAYFYLSGAEVLRKNAIHWGEESKPIEHFLWILMETKAPHGINVVSATDVLDGQTDLVWASGQIIEAMLPDLIAARKSGNWKSFPDQVATPPDPEPWILKWFDNSEYF